VIEDSEIGSGAVVGPFARLRPKAVLEDNVKIGNFVEVKKSRFKKDSKASHLSYIGDATIGERTNIGCGTITCNYDGKNKHQTVIEDDVMVGSDVQFVAPVRIGRGVTIGAGSTITGDVPEGSLAIARSRQVVKRGWKPKK
jgi:bifunctional UDP-N-acetylglucosamine pyrophosphorylase/glucosamine-1-phosphate N-acetyltransferase